MNTQFKNNFQTIPSHPESFFFSFEGTEGAGKSTQIDLLARYLREEKHYEVLTLREPGGTVFGEGLRQNILNAQETIHPLAQAMLFASSRCQLLEQKILPWLQKKRQVVLLDRYFDSSLAYQGIALNLGVENLLQLHQISPLNFMPHATFYLHISLETSLTRIKSRGGKADYFERLDTTWQQKILSGLDLSASLFPERIVTINGERPLQEVTARLKAELERKMLCNP